MRRLTNVVAASTLLLMIATASTLGQTTSTVDTSRESSDENELLMMGNPVVITAAQTLQRVSDSPVAVSVITEEDIRKSGLLSVPDLLRSIPGVDVVENNRGQQNIAIRGFNASFAPSLLVMIDGHSIYQDSFGGVFWSQEPLLISQIKQIEVVRGPGSVLYGANAFGGVVNIITKTPAEMSKDGKTSLLAAYGDEHSSVLETSVTGSTRPEGRGLAYTVGAGFHGTRGIGDLQPGKIRDSVWTPMFTFRGIQPVRNGHVDIAGSTDYGKFDNTTPFTEYVDATSRTNRLSAEYTDDRSHITVGGRSYATAVTEPDNSVSEETSANEFTIQQQRVPSHRHHVIIGGSYRAVTVKSTLMGGASKSDTLAAIYAQDEFEMSKKTHLFTGVRVDDHSIYGVNISPRVSMVHHVDRQQTVRLSYSSAFEDPTLFSSYYNVTLPIAGLPLHLTGNTNIDPQEVHSFEMAYRRDISGGYVEASVFHNSITKLLTSTPGGFVQPPGFPFPIPTTATEVNQGSATADGFEIDSRFKLGNRVDARVNYSYLNTLKDGSRVELSPRNHVNASLDSSLTKRLSGYLAMHFVDSDFGQSFTPTRVNISSYIDFDAKLGYKIGSSSKPWEVAVAATNLFNQPHIEMPNVPVNGQPTSAAIPRRAWLEVSGGW